MRIATFGLLCLLILTATGWLDRPLGRMRIEKGMAAAACVLLLALAALPFDVSQSVSVQPACMLLLLVAGGRCRRADDMLLAFPAAVIAGIADWLLYRVAPGFFEWGLLLAMPQVLIGRLLIRRERATTLCCMLSPLLFSLLLLLEELFVFGEGRLMLGSELLLDVQVCALMLMLLLRVVSKGAGRIRGRRRRRAAAA